MITSCIITAYDQRLEENGKQLELTSCPNGMVEVQIQHSLADAIWVNIDELKYAVENIVNSNKLG